MKNKKATRKNLFKTKQELFEEEKELFSRYRNNIKKNEIIIYYQLVFKFLIN